VITSFNPAKSYLRHSVCNSVSFGCIYQPAVAIFGQSSFLLEADRPSSSWQIHEEFVPEWTVRSHSNFNSTFWTSESGGAQIFGI